MRKYFPYKYGIPSHDVLNSVFNQLDTKEFNYCFISWVNSISDLSEGREIALDGKTICSNASNLGDSKLHIVSAFCTANSLCLGQLKVNKKSNEITSIPALLDLITIQDCIVTIDAMGCQKLIAKKIIEQKGDYILMVKDNQKVLKEQIEKVFGIKSPEMTNIKEDSGHGRIEIRKAEVITKLDFLDDTQEWFSLHSIVRITAERIIKKTNKSSIDTRYYISSLKEDAK